MMKMITPTKEKKSYGDSDEDDEEELTSQQSSESTEKQSLRYLKRSLQENEWFLK